MVRLWKKIGKRMPRSNADNIQRGVFLRLRDKLFGGKSTLARPIDSNKWEEDKPMNTMIPTDTEMLNRVGKALARERLNDTTQTLMKQVKDEMRSFSNYNEEMLYEQLDASLDAIWNSPLPVNESFRASYREQARTAINAANLVLMTRVTT